MAARNNKRSRVDPTVLRAAARRLIASAHTQHSLRSIERLLGLSQGYLSRLKEGAGQPSQALVCLLFLVAQDRDTVPRLAAELPTWLVRFQGGEDECPDLRG